MKCLKLYFVAVVTAMIYMVACNRDAGNGSVQNGPQQKRVYSKTELDRFITPGMSTEEMTNKFGPPGAKVELDQGVTLWAYSFPLSSQKGTYLAGFSVYIKDAKVLRWSPIMGDSHKSFEAGNPQNSAGEKLFQIYFATAELSNIVNRVDAEGSAEISGLTNAPALGFKARVFSGKSGNERPGEQTVILLVSDADKEKLKSLTEDRVGDRLLIVFQGKVVAAPVINAPLDSKQLLFTVRGADVLSTLMN